MPNYLKILYHTAVPPLPHSTEGDWWGRKDIEGLAVRGLQKKLGIAVGVRMGLGIESVALHEDLWSRPGLGTWHLGM